MTIDSLSIVAPVYKVDDGIPSPQTRLSYRSAFSLFLKHIGKDNNKQADLDSLRQTPPRLLEAQIIDYIHFLAEEKHYGRASINVPVSAILHFFEMNDVMLNKRKIKRFLPEDVSDHNSDRPYTNEEIQQMLLKCDERARVVILLMASTGMRIGAVPALQIGHLIKIPEHNLYKITVYANFPRARYYCFSTPECAAAIDSYLSYRRRFGDPLAKTAPLIREQFEIKDPFAAANPRPIAHRTIVYIIEEILKRSGLKTKEVMRSHGLRKRAITLMIKAKVDYSTREFLVGHKVSRGLDVSYDRTSEEDRLSEFLRAVDYLTICSENRLKNKIHQLESEHSAEWKQLKEQINELKRLIEPAATAATE